MKTYRIGITDYVQAPAVIEQEAFPEAEFIFLKPGGSKTDLDGILVWHEHINPNFVAELSSRCKMVVRYGVGFENIDIKALSEKNILFANTPDYGTEEVADTACAMILAAQRKLFHYDQVARSLPAHWQKVSPPIGRISKSTLGIIGVGRIGTAVICRMKSFGWKILGYDPYLPSGHERAISYQRVSHLSELLEQSDVVSIHCPETPETFSLVDEEFVKTMKKGSVLVNTARGRIVSSLDVFERALDQKHLSAVALDVLPQEPPGRESGLIRRWCEGQWEGRVIINPHSAYYSEQAWYEMRYKAAETLRLFLLHGQKRNLISAT